MSPGPFGRGLTGNVRRGTILLAGISLWCGGVRVSGDDTVVYEQRVEAVRRTPGLAAFWDFVLREDGVKGRGRFMAYTAAGDDHRYLLEPQNIAREYWHEGPEGTLADFPLLGRGPFGQAVHFQSAKTLDNLPVLCVPRENLQDTPLDIKGPGKSVSMVVWLIYQGGGHAIAGIWHEGTVTHPGVPAVVKENGRRQFALFAGLAANPGAVGAHVSENGVASFGDPYARHFAVTSAKLKNVGEEASPEELDAGWSAAGFVFDSAKKSVTAYLDGIAAEHWIDHPAGTNFYKAAARAWKQARLAKIPGIQPGEDLKFPADQFYEPPEGVPLHEEVLAGSADERTVVRTYEYTKVRVTLRRDANGEFAETPGAELLALKVNPYWFGHDLYAPKTADDGGPFTIGRVIHSGRKGSLTAFIGGVAVYDRALSAEQMLALARIGRTVGASSGKPAILHYRDIRSPLDSSPTPPGLP